MSYFIFWICFNLKIECIIENDILSIALLVRENRHNDIWLRIRLNQTHFKKLGKSIDIIKNKKKI